MGNSTRGASELVRSLRRRGHTRGNIGSATVMTFLVDHQSGLLSLHLEPNLYDIQRFLDEQRSLGTMWTKH